jgi:valyl-tRNA synthetase
MTPEAPAFVSPTVSRQTGLENKLGTIWEPENEGVYRFDQTKTRAQIYAIDPRHPRSAVHCISDTSSATRTPTLSRYQRMHGREVFYPWLGDNGLPMERRVQTYFRVWCNPALPYDWISPAIQQKIMVSCSRRNSIELCEQSTAIDEQAFEDRWRRLRLSH